MSKALDIVREDIVFHLNRLDKEFQRRLAYADLNASFLDAVESNIALDAKFLYWLLSQLKPIRFTSVKELFTASEIERMIELLAPAPKGCYDFSYKAVSYMENVCFVDGKKVMFDCVTAPHGVNKIILPDESVHYFDFISEIVLGENVADIEYVAYKDFTDVDELKKCAEISNFFDRILFIWFQRNIYPKKVVRV